MAPGSFALRPAGLKVCTADTSATAEKKDAQFVSLGDEARV